MPKLKISLWVSTCLLLMLPILGNADEWQKINDPKSLDEIYNDTVLVGVQWEQSQFHLNFAPTDWNIEYCQDGTGQLTFKGIVSPRSWKIKGKDQVCITTEFGEKCYFYERHLKYKGLYRNGLVGSKTPTWVFRVSDQKPTICKK